jgi:hypothetical protein
MSLTDPVYSITIDPRSGNVSPLSLSTQEAIPYKMEWTPTLVGGSTETIDITKVTGLYKIIFVSKASEIDPLLVTVPTVKVSLSVLKLPSPTQSITFEFQDEYVWSIPQSYVQYVKSFSLTTDSTIPFVVDARLLGK